MYFVYILTNFTNKVLYVGVTNNISRRYFEHYNKINPFSFSAKYKCNKLVWFLEFRDIREAIIVEKKIKRWVRIKKVELVEGLNPKWIDLMEKDSSLRSE